MKSKHLFISAGEVSGDVHAGELMKALKKLNPRIVFSGIGGKNMSAAGLHPITGDVSTRSTIGLTAGLRFYFFFRRLYKVAVDFLKKHKVDMVVLVDNQGFNIPLMKAAKALGIPTVYYFPPHVSIWGEWNAPVLAKYADHIVCPNAADTEVYKKAGASVYFSGNPLLDKTHNFKMNRNFISRFHIDKRKKSVALLPGSRYQEIETLLPVMLDAAKVLIEKHGLQVLLPVSHAAFRKQIESMVERSGLTGRVILLDGHSYEAMNVSDVNILSSGTASLESALFHKPPVICYRISALSFFIGKMLVKKKMIGLPNIILDRVVFPELLQKECNAGNIVKQTLHYLHLGADKKAEQEEYFRQIRKNIGDYPVVSRTAKHLTDILQKGEPTAKTGPQKKSKVRKRNKNA